jgi:hypothetical protein
MGSKLNIFMAVVAALLVFILFCPDAKAQVRVEFKLLPPGELALVDGNKMRVYGLDEWLALAKFDAELMKLRADIVDYTGIVERLEKQLVEKDKQIASLERDKGVMVNRSERLDKELDKCEGEVIELAGGPIWPYIVGGTGAVVGIIGAVMWAVGSVD